MEEITIEDMRSRLDERDTQQRIDLMDTILFSMNENKGTTHAVYTGDADDIRKNAWGAVREEGVGDTVIFKAQHPHDDEKWVQVHQSEVNFWHLGDQNT